MNRIPTRRSRLLPWIALCLLAHAAPAAATWSLVWSDEFDGTALNTADWNYDIGTGCPSLCGWGNAELQYYRSQNVAVSGGELIITAKAESYGGAQYTSGKIHTRNKRSFLYGRMEMRAKLPTGGGMWPAFWMMPQADVYGGWAASGEIDIMESANATTTVGGALHYGGTWPDNTSTSSSTTLGGASFSDDYHVYAVEWEPDAIRWYVDDTLYGTRTSAQWYSDGAPANPRAPFDQAFYIILNAAVGGYYTGCTDPSCVTADLPQEYRVDYVRVYEDIENFAPTVELTSPAPGATLPAGDVLIEANAADSDGTVVRVEFYEGATLLGQDATAPYSFLWASVPDGCYALTARAVDDLGGTAEAVADVTVGAGCGQAPYPGTAPLLPARIEAEDYDVGGEGVAYHDLDVANSGGAYRTAEGVDVEVCYDVDGGYDVGWTGAGEWLEYTVEVPADGVYPLALRVASLSSGGTVRLSAAGVDLAGDVALPVTTGWQTWQSVDLEVPLHAGTTTLRLAALTDGFNLNYLEFGDAVTDVAPSARAVLHPPYPNPFNPSTTLRFELPAAARVRLAVYDAAGRAVRRLVDGELLGAGAHARTWDGRDGSGRAAPAGVYFCRMETAGRVETRRLALVK